MGFNFLGFGFIRRIYSIILLLIALFSCSSYDTNDINKYEGYYGVDGKQKECLVGYNNIFPDTIANKDNVLNFYAVKDVNLDDCYLGYLVVYYDEIDYSKEVNRLSSIKCDFDYHVFGIDGFEKELVSYITDETFGIIYALKDDFEHTISYIDIQFQGEYYCIDLNQYLYPEDLPKGFNVNYDIITEEFDSVGA